MKHFYYLFIVILLFLIPTLGWGGDLRLHPAFSSNMVLQREMLVNIFGSGNPGATVTVTFADQSLTTTVDENGKWKVTLAPLEMSASPAVLNVKSESENINCQNVLVGDVWFCSGQSNMARSIKSFNQLTPNIASISRPLVRVYLTAHEIAKTPSPVPLKPSKKTEAAFNQWQESKPEILLEASPLACFFADKVSDELKIPIGLLISAWGSTVAEAWAPQEILESLHLGNAPTADPDGPAPQSNPSFCYNGLVHPFLDVTFKGFLWSQGESNAKKPETHRILFPALIQCWRERFHAENRPFYFMQLAPDGPRSWDTTKEAWAWLRETQTEALKLPYTGMTVITDLGEFDDIHPQTKKEAGERLALFALRDAGLPVEPVSPMFKSMQIEGNRCKIEFSHAESGLETRRVVMNKKKDQPIQKDPEAFIVEADHLQGFTICGGDQKFVAAQAAIVDGHVEVWNDAITAPVAVRYAWSTFPLCNLFSKAGLPANPFRTDDFPMPILQPDKKK